MAEKKHFDSGMPAAESRAEEDEDIFLIDAARRHREMN